MSSMRSVLLSLLYLFCFLVAATPLVPTPTRTEQSLIDSPSLTLERRTDPTFPPSPPSCLICAQSYPSISSCAQAAPAFANFTQIIFAPGEFIELIKCACTDTFESAFPQCVDCFQQTNQTAVLDPAGDDLPSVVSGLRSVCALASTLLSNVTGANGEQVNGTPSAVPLPGGSAATMTPSSHLVLLVKLSMSMALALAGSLTLW